MSHLSDRDKPHAHSRPEYLQLVPSEGAPDKTRQWLATAASAAATLATRTLGLGALGFGLGLVAFVAERLTGVLDVPTASAWGALVYLLLPLYLAAGTVGLGAAGFWRGVGRVAMNLVQQHALSQRLVDQVMKRAAARLSQVSAEPLHRPLPVQQARDVLETALRETERSDDDVSGLNWVARAVVRRVRRLVLRRVESGLNVLIGEQTRDASAVELTLHRVNELAHERLDAWVMDSLDGLRNKQALLWSALFAATVAVPPLVLHFLR